jgi:hypothetical protein
MQQDTQATNSDPFAQISSRIEEANNVLVTVSANPSVDQLSALIGLTVALNKKGKHATAVFSGKVPAAIDFLEPNRTIEKNTDSLQDFIISLDKSKADKLRYKVEDDHVKIFITPYKTSVSEADLQFSQGDFNIDLIIAIGIHNKNDLDNAIIAHGRILHDATVATLTIDTLSDLGSISWLDGQASSLCEMVTDLINTFGKDLIDSQIATALLTGMVAETDRFGNEKATPRTMSLSGALMAAGASPQLISNELKTPEPSPEPEQPATEDPSEELPVVVEVPSEDETEEPAPVIDDPEEVPAPEPAPAKPKKNDDGVFKIDHEDDIHIDDDGRFLPVDDLPIVDTPPIPEVPAPAEPVVPTVEDSQPSATGDAAVSGRGLVFDPPTLGGQLTANSEAEGGQASGGADQLGSVLKGRTIEPLSPNQTLSDIEQSVGSTHATDDQVSQAQPPLPPELNDARSAVEQAENLSDNPRPEPRNDVGSTQVDFTQTPPPQDPSNDSGTPPPPVPPPMPPTSFGV